MPTRFEVTPGFDEKQGGVLFALDGLVDRINTDWQPAGRIRLKNFSNAVNSWANAFIGQENQETLPSFAEDDPRKKALDDIGELREMIDRISKITLLGQEAFDMINDFGRVTENFQLAVDFSTNYHLAFGFDDWKHNVDNRVGATLRKIKNYLEGYNDKPNEVIAFLSKWKDEDSPLIRCLDYLEKGLVTDGPILEKMEFLDLKVLFEIAADKAEESGLEVRVRPAIAGSMFPENKMKGHLIGDKHQWFNAIYNLISNAQKYSKKDGQVGVFMWAGISKDGMGRIIFTDNGKGFGEDMLTVNGEGKARALEQGVTTDGTGHGLFSIDRYFESIGGKVSIGNASEYGASSLGAVVVIDFPLVPDSARGGT